MAGDSVRAGTTGGSGFRYRAKRNGQKRDHIHTIGIAFGPNRSGDHGVTYCMIHKPSQAAGALSLEFVADLSYNPRTNQYRIDLVEPFRSEMPRTRNFLLVDVAGFTVQKVLEAFDTNVILFYQNKCDQAQEILRRVRREQGESV